MKYSLLLFAFLSGGMLLAQNDPEFPKGAVMYLSAQQGKSTSFNSSPELWVGGISLSPQFTLLPQHLRAGAVAEWAYTKKQGSALFGPLLALKIKTVKKEPFGSILNIQLQADHLWGTRHQRMIGGGLTIEAIQLFCFNITAHRDYSLNQWWFRGGVGIDILHKRKSGSTDPFKKNNRN